MIRAFVIATLLLVPMARAAAQDDELDARARTHFEAGTDYFDRGDYENALDELQIAYDMSHRPELLYNLGACYERMGRLSEAADNFDAYVAALPDADNAAAVTERAARLRARAAAAEARHDEPTGATTVEPGSGAAVDVVAPAESRGTAPHPAGFVVLGAGALGLIAFGTLGGLALSEDGALASSCGTACPPDRVSTLDAYALGADISLGIGAALAIAGTIMLFTVTEPTGPATDGASVRLGIGPGGVSIAASL